MARDAYQPFAGLARPTYNVGPFKDLSALRVEDFIARLLWIIGIRAGDISGVVVRKSQGRIGNVTNGKDHGVHIQVSSFVSGFRSHIAVAVYQDVFGHTQSADASRAIRVDGLRRTQEAKQ